MITNATSRKTRNITLSTLSGENLEAFKLLRCGVPVNEPNLAERN